MKNTIIGLLLGIIITVPAFYLFIGKSIPQPNLTDITPTSTLPTNTPLPTQVPDEDLIKIALAKKYSLSLDQISVIFKEVDSTHAAGTVSFSGEGGWFLAAKVNNDWTIVQDGNGIVSCDAVSPYSFPVSMVPECVDTHGQLIKL